jgi:methylated-DNA-[protein]-cysteine S-methyltransferase
MSARELGSLERALRAGAAASDEDAAGAAARLRDAADEAGLVEVAYGTLDTPIGTMLVATTPRGLVRVGLPGEAFDRVLDQVSTKVSPRVLEVPRRVDEARRELDDYFEGRRRRFDMRIDWRLVHGPFARKLLAKLPRRVRFGSAITYAQAAAMAGSPTAHRAAGNVLGSNPLPLVVPCHRVVLTSGEPGGYGGGPELKRYLLRHEGWLD